MACLALLGMENFTCTVRRLLMQICNICSSGSKLHWIVLNGQIESGVCAMSVGNGSWDTQEGELLVPQMALVTFHTLKHTLPLLL